MGRVDDRKSNASVFVYGVSVGVLGINGDQVHNVRKATCMLVPDDVSGRAKQIDEMLAALALAGA